MQRSYSHTYISTQVSPQMTLPPPNIVLEGKLLKKVQDHNSAIWNGLALQEQPFEPKKNVDRRWKESQDSKRTIDPFYYANEPAGILSTSQQRSSANLTEMINRGFSREVLGNLNKRVVVAGKHQNVNAMSFENTNASSSIFDAYRDLHPVNIGNIEKRQKKPSLTGETKNSSSVFICELSPAARTVRTKPDFISSINELPGCLKNTEPEMSYQNPNVKFSRNTATSIEKIEVMGERTRKFVPRQEIVPSVKNFTPSYITVGQEAALNPYTRGKARNCLAEDRLLRGSIAENDLVLSKKGRPASARNMFSSSFTLA